ncbi:MAG: ankyrin repeat domain-containing protein [Alphaproteobacteria bacterium]|nr:ankyrin repeat domain-containing protein [Alphaproteobacteria bacterium]
MDIEKLEKLCNLKEKGILTQEEFEEEKKKILDIATAREKKNEHNKVMMAPQKNINWKNVAISFFIALLWMFIFGIVSVSFQKYIDEKTIKICSVILTATILSFLAYKLKTKQYKNYAPAWEVFIGVIFLQAIGVWIVIYQFLQIKEGCAVLKDENAPKEKINLLKITGLIIVFSAVFAFITALATKAYEQYKINKTIEEVNHLIINILTLGATSNYEFVNSKETLFKAYVIPKSLVSGDKLINRYGGEVSLSGSGNDFQIVFNSIPEAVCKIIRDENWNKGIIVSGCDDCKKSKCSIAWATTLDYNSISNNLINADWWKTATFNDVKQEIANGTDINSKGNDYTKSGDLRTNVTPLVFAIKYGNSNPEIIKFLINSRADVNAKEGKVGLTVLMYVAQFCKNPNIMNMLIQAGADVNVGSNSGFTPLMSAVIHKNPQMVKAFIENGANISAKDSNNKTALDYAYEYNDVEFINLLKNYTTKVNIPDLAQNLLVPNSVSGNFSNNLINADWWKKATLKDVKKEIANNADVNIGGNDRSTNGEARTNVTPLMFALKYNNPSADIIQTLIKAGADVNAKEGTIGITPLMYAIERCQDLKVMKVLIQAGADVNAKANNGVTPLMYAAHISNNSEIIRELIQAGANVNETEKSTGLTSLMVAASNNSSLQVLQTLIHSGADINAKSNEGVTPLMFAAKHTTNPEIINTLLNAGADIKAKGNNGVTPLIFAAFNNNPQVIETLVRTGANINESDNIGATPLMIAAKHTTNPEIVNTLLKAGADVNAKDNDGETPLMYAAGLNNNPEVIKALIQVGADVNAKYNKGLTPLMIAIVANKNPQVAKILIENGADISIQDANNKTALDYANDSNNAEFINLLKNHTTNK